MAIAASSSAFIDIALAPLVLVMATPLMLALAVMVRLSSPGPVIFKQRRYGLDGREIMVYKFRTMNVIEDGPNIVQASKADARITGVGRFMRRYSLDELPQLLNVLQGHMSLVGPRPHAVAHNEEYRKLIKGYMIRHKVPPGITGLAQVNGCRGETARVEDMQARVNYDLEYLRQWSPLLDLKILVLTALRFCGTRTPTDGAISAGRLLTVRGNPSARESGRSHHCAPRPDRGGGSPGALLGARQRRPARGRKDDGAAGHAPDAYGTPEMPSGFTYPRAMAQFYLMVGSALAFGGPSEWTFRLPSAICGVLLILLT